MSEADDFWLGMLGIGATAVAAKEGDATPETTRSELARPFRQGDDLVPEDLIEEVGRDPDAVIDIPPPDSDAGYTLSPDEEDHGWAGYVTQARKQDEVTASAASVKMHPVTPVTEEALARIASAPWVAISLAVTGDSPHLSMKRVTQKTALEDGSLWKEHSADAVIRGSRIRAVAVSLPEDILYCFDLDTLDSAGASYLARQMIEGKIVIGDNLHTDLCWLRSLTDANPALLVDLNIVLKTLRSSINITLHEQAAEGHDPSLAYLKSLPSRLPLAPVNTATARVHVGLPANDGRGEMRQAKNWLIHDLTPRHTSHLVEQIADTVRLIAEVLTPHERTSHLSRDDIVARILRHIRAYPLYKDWSVAAVRLADMHRNGIPVDMERLRIYEAARIIELNDNIDYLVQHAPEMAACRDDMRELTMGETRSMVQAFHNYCLRVTGNGGQVSDTETMSEHALSVSGAMEDGVIKRYVRVRELRHVIYQLQNMAQMRGEDGRLHPMVSIRSITGIISLTTPSTANGSSEPGYRAITAAQPGHVIVSLDYAQIELRIAAALAVRNYRNMKTALSSLSRSGYNSYKKFLEWLDFSSIWNTSQSHEITTTPPEPPGRNAEIDDYKLYYQRMFAHLLNRVYRQGHALADGFRQQIDPHLLTGLGIAMRRNDIQNVEPGQTALSYMKSLTPPELAALECYLKEDRQAAKPQNFGLIYGMGETGLWEHGVREYALKWSIEEARESRLWWLYEQYPEVALWQFWSKTVEKSRSSIMLRDFTTKEFVLNPKGKYWIALTLDGRQISATQAHKALNVADQGTRADIMHRALARLPDETVPYLINSIYDELLFEFPEAEAGRLTELARAAMVSAAEASLHEYDIPVSVSASTGATWT